MSTTTKTPERLRRELTEIWNALRDEGEEGTLGQVMELFEADVNDVQAVRQITQGVLESLGESLIPALLLATMDDSEKSFETFLSAFQMNTEYAVDSAFLFGLAVGREHERRGYSLDA